VRTWKEAHELIEGKIRSGTNLGITESEPILVTGLIRDGFQINCGRRIVNLKWFVLEHCWKTMNKRRIFNLEIFKELFGEECLGEPFCVDLVGRIFLKTNLAKTHSNTYHNYTEPLFHQLPLQFDARTQAWG